MQNPYDADAFGMGFVRHGPIDDDVRTDQVSQVRWQQIVPRMAELKISADSLECRSDLFVVNLDLLRSSGLTGVAKDPLVVLFRSLRKFKRERLTGGHRGPWVHRYAWPSGPPL